MGLSPISSARTSPAPSEVSAPPTPRTVHSVAESSPFQPAFSSIQVPQNVQRALAAPPAMRVQAPRPPLPAPPAQPAPPAKRPFFRKLAAVGSLACAAGVIAGLVSIVVLGPLGIGIAGAFLVSAIALGRIASKAS